MMDSGRGSVVGGAQLCEGLSHGSQLSPWNLGMRGSVMGGAQSWESALSLESGHEELSHGRGSVES